MYFILVQKSHLTIALASIITISLLFFHSQKVYFTRSWVYLEDLWHSKPPQTDKVEYWNPVTTGNNKQLVHA